MKLVTFSTGEACTPAGTDKTPTDNSIAATAALVLKDGLVTLAEHKSRYMLAGHIRSKHAVGVTPVTTRLLTPYKGKCHTIAFDNGKEFAEHAK